MQELKTYYYNDGNAVRKETEYVMRPARSLPTREQREQEKREDAIRRQKITDRRRAAALRKNRLLTGYMIMAVMLTCIMLVGYVSLQTNVTTRMNRIADMENQLSTINADNNAAESRIATNTNLSEIKDKAINELGMVYATSSQIVYYSVDGSDYMSQYKDIP
jgi:cell division protein FtsL